MDREKAQDLQIVIKAYGQAVADMRQAEDRVKELWNRMSDILFEEAYPDRD